MEQGPSLPTFDRLVIEQRSLMLIEGVSDLGFWRSLLQNMGRSDIQVERTGGKDNLRLMLPNIVRQSDFRSRVQWVGILQDADRDAQACFDRIRGALRLAGLAVPARSWETVGTSPSVVAAVLPDGASSGDFELLLWQSLQDRPRIECVDAYIECLGRNNLVPRQESKARVHAYLASLARPDQQLSIAVLRGELGGQAFQRLLDILPVRRDAEG